MAGNDPQNPPLLEPNAVVLHSPDMEIANVVETLGFNHPGRRRNQLPSSRNCPDTATTGDAGLLVRARVHVDRRMVLLVDMPTDDGRHDGDHNVCLPFYVLLA
jgi:hypothetical protein